MLWTETAVQILAAYDRLCPARPRTPARSRKWSPTTPALGVSLSFLTTCGERTVDRLFLPQSSDKCNCPAWAEYRHLWWPDCGLKGWTWSRP